MSGKVKFVTDHVFGGVSSPVLIELCVLLRGFFGEADVVDRIDQLADADLYRHITFAASQRHSGRPFAARRAPELDPIAVAVMRRVSISSMAATSPRSPQSRFARDAAPPEVALVDQPVADDKPAGALWTSSFLPDGTSMWQWGEWAEFGRDRRLFALTFDPADVRVCTIGFDAVHLTVAGLLTAQHVPIATPHGAAMLTGWDAESTAWLRLPPGLTTTPAP